MSVLDLTPDRPNRTSIPIQSIILQRCHPACAHEEISMHLSPVIFYDFPSPCEFSTLPPQLMVHTLMFSRFPLQKPKIKKRGKMNKIGYMRECFLDKIGCLPEYFLDKSEHRCFHVWLASIIELSSISVWTKTSAWWPKSGTFRN